MVHSREEACDAIAELIFSAQVTTARNMELMVSAICFLQQPAEFKSGHAELDAAQPADPEQWFEPATAAALTPLSRG
ncbi:transcriptional regulator [Klebsiella michiganensis]|nr:transcriptional regulator [Klebsiella michiganensis]